MDDASAIPRVLLLLLHLLLLILRPRLSRRSRSRRDMQLVQQELKIFMRILLLITRKSLFTLPARGEEIHGSETFHLVLRKEFRKHFVHGARHAVLELAVFGLVAVREIEVAD